MCSELREASKYIAGEDNLDDEKLMGSRDISKQEGITTTGVMEANELEPKPWEALLLDAQDELASVGQACDRTRR